MSSTNYKKLTVTLIKKSVKLNFWWVQSHVFLFLVYFGRLKSNRIKHHFYQDQFG